MEDDEIYLDRPPRYAIPEEENSYSKLQLRTLGPFKVLEVILNTVETSRNGLESVVSKERVSKAPRTTTPLKIAS